MSDRSKISLAGMWLIFSSACLVLPVFVPSAPFSAGPTASVIGLATITMFILSFPSSLIGIPLAALTELIAGIDPNSIMGMYVKVLVYYVLGLVQWFWIVPRVWRNEPEISVLQIPAGEAIESFPEMSADSPFEVLDKRERTPIERVIIDDQE